MLDRWRSFVLGRSRADFMVLIPRVLRAVRAGSSEVRAGLVDHRDFESFRLSLALSSDVDVHAVELAITVAVKRGHNPQVVLDPLFRVIEGVDNLGLAIGEFRLRWLRLLCVRRCLH